MYILIEPADFPDCFQNLARLAVAAVAAETGLPVGPEGEIDGPVDGDAVRVVQIVEHLLDLVYDDGAVPGPLSAFLAAVLADLQER